MYNIDAMKTIILILSIACSFCQLNAQDDFQSNYISDGIYLTLQDFIDGEPSNTKKVEARDISKPKKRKAPTGADVCFFNYRRTKKRVKDAYAIVQNGDIYIQIDGMKKHMQKKDRKKMAEDKHAFLRALNVGEFLYFEAFTQKGGGGFGLSLGGGPISVGTGGGRGREELKAVVFDYESTSFDLIRDCKDFRKFLEVHQPDNQFDCPKKSIPLEIVRKTIVEMNTNG